MSTNKTKKVISRLHPGEAVVVGKGDWFRQLAALCLALSRMTEYSEEDRETWADTAAWLLDSVRETEFYSEDLEEE